MFDLIETSGADRILAGSVAGPVYRFRVREIAQGIDLNIIGNHEGGIETQSEMTDNIILIRLILVFLKECAGARESDLCNVLLYFRFCHAQTRINKLDGLLIRVHDHLDTVLMIVRILILPHNFELVQLGDRVASVGDQFSYENIMITVEPFLNDRQHIFAVD